MKRVSKSLRIKIETVATFLIMIMINVLANIFRLNGATTKEVTRLYDGLFVPEPFVFMIWIPIYILLLIYVIFVLLSGNEIESGERSDFYTRTTLYFVASSVANSAWIFAWHNDLIMMSMICSSFLFAILSAACISFRRVNLRPKEIAFVQVPFSFYLGWIIVSLLANASVVMNKFSVASTGKPEEYWTIIFIIILTVLTIALKIWGRNPIYGIPVIWGLLGILVRHISGNGYGYQYPDIVVVVIICIGLFSIVTAYYLFSGKSFKKRKNDLAEAMASVVEEATAENTSHKSFKEFDEMDKN